MADKIEYSRLLVKRSDNTGVLPTIPTGTTLNTFSDTDTFIGEFFLNTMDDRLWIRTDNGQFEIMMSGGTSGYSQNLAQTLLLGNETFGNNIIFSSGDTLQSVSGNSFIQLTDTENLSKFDDGIITNEIKMFNSGSTFSNTDGTDTLIINNTPTKYQLNINDTSSTDTSLVEYTKSYLNFSNTDGIDSSTFELFKTSSSFITEVSNIQTLFIADPLYNSGGLNGISCIDTITTSYSEVDLQPESIILNSLNTGQTTTIQINPSGITINTLSLIINNLPTDPTGLVTDQLYTQTSTELGGTGTTKVICVV